MIAPASAPQHGDERDRPGSREGPADAARPPSPTGSGTLVAGEDLEEDVGGESKGLVEDDGAQSRDDADDRAQHEPLLGVAGGGQPPIRGALAGALELR